MRFSKKMLASLLAATSMISPLSVSADTTSAATTTFNDLDQAASWSRDSILQAKLLGLFEGDPQGNFRPGDQITRQEMAKILVQLLNLPLETTTTSSFADVDSNAWSAAYIEAALKAGIMQGYGNGKFDPQAVMTREQLAIVIVKALGLPIENDTTALNRFDDAAKIHDWSARYVAAALKAGLMTGSGSTFGATATANRQEAAMVAVRVHTQKQQAAQTGSGDGASTTPGTSTTGTPTVPGTVVPTGTTTPPVGTPSNPAPPAGGGSTTPVTPPVTPPAEPPTVPPTPIEQSLPAIAVSEPLHTLDFKNVVPTVVTIVSEPITNLDFSIKGTLASANSNTISDTDFSSNHKTFTISDGSTTATIELIENYSGLESIVSKVNQQLDESGVDASALFDQDSSTMIVSRKSFDHGGKLVFGEKDASDFFTETTYDPSIVEDRSTQIEFILDKNTTVTIPLNRQYESLDNLAKRIVNSLNSTSDTFRSMVTESNTIAIYSTGPDAYKQVVVTQDSDNRFFKPDTYLMKDGEVRQKSFSISDGTSSTVLSLSDSFDDMKQLTDELNRQLEFTDVQVFLEPNSPDTFKITSRSIGRQSIIQIDEQVELDGDQFFSKKSFFGSGPELDQAPLIGGVPIRSQANPLITASFLVPVSKDTDITDVQLVRTTQSGIDYDAVDYRYPVDGYTLGTLISEDGAYRLTVKDRAGHQTVTYFSIDHTVPAVVSVTQQQNDAQPNNPYVYDQGDQITFTLNTFVYKYDSQDQLNQHLRWIDILMLEALENDLKLASPSSDTHFTFGSGATLTTDKVMKDNPLYGKTFTITLGSGAVIPSTGVTVSLTKEDLVSHSGLRPSGSVSLTIPALPIP